MDTGAKAGTPDGNGGVTHIPGDWRETMSTHWFHDHMFSYTAQNVYKGNAAMFNIYSALDRGNKEIDDTNHVNLRLPSGTKADWGNLDYDVNLMLADKAWGPDGQLAFDIFNFDGFLGDVMTVNLAYKPFFQVERRKYRFRILNASVARFFKIALADASGRAQPVRSDCQRRQPAAPASAADGDRPDGHCRALRHHHRLLEFPARRHPAPRQPVRARRRQGAGRQPVDGGGVVGQVVRSVRRPLPRIQDRAEP